MVSFRKSKSEAVAGSSDYLVESGPTDGRSDGGRGTLDVGARTYCVGMLWSGVEQVSKAASEAKAKARMPNISADFYCIRNDGQPQFGLGSKESGHKSGMPSLAAHLADSMTGSSWIGMFREGGVYYFIAVRDDAILSECDRIVFDEGEAVALFHEFHGATAWDRVFAPAEWEVDGAEQMSISDLLVRRPTVKLREVDTTRSALKVALFAVVLTAGVFGVAWLNRDVLQGGDIADVQAMFQRPQTTVVQSSDGKAQTQKPPPAPPWEGKSTGISFIASCTNEIRRLDLAIPGWRPTKAACSGTVAALFLERQGGTLNWIGAHLNPRSVTKPSISPQGDMGAVVTYPLPTMTVYPREILRTERVSEVKRYLISHFEEIFHKITFKPLELATAEEKAYYDGVAFSFTSNADPVKFITILSRLSAMTIDTITFDFSKQNWIVEGKVYEKRDNPLVFEPHH